MFETVYKAESYIVDAEGADDEAAKLGLQWLIQFALKRKSEAGLFVATLRQVDNFSRFLGRGGAEALRKHRLINVNGVRVHLLTERILPYEFAGPILCMWVDDEQLEPIEGLGAPAICAIPWLRADLTNWKLARTPTDLRTGIALKGAAPNPVLAAALRSLTTSVNVGTGLAHPSDKAAAIDLFLTLSPVARRSPVRPCAPWRTNLGGKPKTRANSVSSLRRSLLAAGCSRVSRRACGGEHPLSPGGAPSLMSERPQRAAGSMRNSRSPYLPSAPASAVDVPPASQRRLRSP